MHRTTKKNPWLLLAMLTLFAGQVHAQDDAAVAAAESATRAWLGLTDAGQYAESWDAASSYFRAAITVDDWAQALIGARSPLGGSWLRRARTRGA